MNSSTPQIIYEQGGGNRGMSIYIIQNKLYFYAWNGGNDGDYSPWGFKNNSTSSNSLGVTFIESTTSLVAGENYVVSCHYGRAWVLQSETDRPFAGLRMYINGVLDPVYAPVSGANPIGRLYFHSGRASIGSAWHQTKVHNLTSIGPSGTEDMSWFFKGKIGEFLYLNEPRMNESRVRILHNYFSSKYNLPLGGGNQDFDLDYADNTSTAMNPAFNYNMAGVGKADANPHGDSQGQSEMRVTNPGFQASTAFLNWGHNGEALTNTWPYSNTNLPAAILERSGKVWRFSANPPGGISTVDIRIRYSAAHNAPAFSADQDMLKLLINTTGDPNDFSTAAVYDMEVLSGNIALFSNVPVTDGMYITLANTNTVYPLPIELLNFGVRFNGLVVDVFWSTSSEYNNDYFIIERTGANLKWEELMQIPGAGNSNTHRKYLEKDHNPLQGIAYYRLKQVDYDGTYKYSDIESVINNTSESGNDTYIFPNPNSGTSVFIRIPVSNAHGRVGLYNLSGIKIQEMEIPQNSTTFEFTYGNLPPGVYFVKIENQFIQEVKKLVIQ